MTKINFQNLPNTTTPLNATNMNAIQTNAETAINAIDTIGLHGTYLEENDDLNNLTTAGVYYAGSSNIAATLSNTPVTTAAFKLIVECLARNDRLVQTIKVNDATSSKVYYSRTYQGSWGAWQKVNIGEVLYYNAAGSTTGNVTLSKTINNFDEIEIMYGVAGYHKSVKIPVRLTASNLNVTLDGMYVGSQNMVIGSQVCALLGTTLTRGNSAGKNINLSTNAITNNDTLTFAIYKVIGY